MALTIKLKESFDVEAQYGAFYTGGVVAWTSNGEELLCQNEGKINVISVDSGNINKVIGEPDVKEVDEDIIYTFALSDSDQYVLTGHKSGLIKLWSKIDGSLVKTWKGNHKGPIAKLSFRSTGHIVASGGSDSIVRTWNYDKKTCLSALKGSQGVISIVKFHPKEEHNLVFAAGDDNVINCWDFVTKELLKTFTGHFSKVTSIAFTLDGQKLVSVGRDKVLILWDIESSTQVRTIPVYESLEGVCILPTGLTLPNEYKMEAGEKDDLIYAAIAGENGVVSVWECTSSKIVFAQTNSLITKASEKGGLAISQLLHNPTKSQLAVVSVDHNIMVHNISTFHCAKQLIGFSDDILDICFLGKKGRYLAVATNSNDIKLYDTTNMNCQILKGHTDIILGFSSYKNLLLSCAKDNSIRIWEVNPGNFTVRCVARGAKHTASVGSVAFGRTTHTFCVSVSQDTCLKLWDVPNVFDNSEEVVTLACTNTQIAHEKDVNNVTVSPNDKLIATASQDKTVKIWSAEKLELVGVLRGHRRGVWCVRFSPVDQVIMTSSADCSIKLWSISDLSCLKTIEGHESSILRVEFITKGMQIMSAGADGLLKLWTIKTSECVATLDKHESRVWTVAVAPDETYFFSGGSDSQLIRWKDVTEEKKVAEFEERQKQILEEQELNNLVAEKKMLKALKYALKLDRPSMTLKIINSVIKNQESGLEETVNALTDMHKESLLKHAISWNTNSKFCRPAQLVLNILLNEVVTNKFHPSGLDKLVEESIPYTERHFKRMTEYLKDLKFIEFTLKCMQPHGRV